MKRMTLVGLVVGLVLWGAGAAVAQLPTDYWRMNSTDVTNYGPNDLIGSYNASVQAGYTPSYGTGASGTANDAMSVYGGSGGGTGGYNTAMTTFGAGIAGSPFSYEIMFDYTGTPYRYGFITNRGGMGGYPGPVCLTAELATTSDIQLAVGGTDFNTGIADPPKNTWYDWTVTYDGTNLDLYLTPYSTNATAQLVYTTTNTSLTPASSVPLTFGCTDGSRYGANGYFNWAAVFNYALTPARIATHVDNDSPLPQGTWWNGSGSDANFSTGPNWSSGAPAPGAEVDFGAATARSTCRITTALPLPIPVFGI